MKIVKSDSFVFEIEPGDGTKYNFVITNISPKNNVICSGISPTKFVGYYYHIDSIREFFDRHIIDMGYNEWVYNLNDPFIGYIMDHSDCNKYAAMAFLLCAKELL